MGFFSLLPCPHYPPTPFSVCVLEGNTLVISLQMSWNVCSLQGARGSLGKGLQIPQCQQGETNPTGNGSWRKGNWDFQQDLGAEVGASSV